MITLRELLRYERLTGRTLLGASPEDTDLEALLYVTDPEARGSVTLQEYRAALAGIKTAYHNTRIEQLNKELALAAQYVQKKSNDADDNHEEQVPLQELIPSLVAFSGADMGYILDQMELWEIPLLVQAAERRQRAEMTAQRLWTFLQLLPHIDTKKIKSPTDLLPFDWEQAPTPRTQSDLAPFEQWINEGLQKEYGLKNSTQEDA